LRKLLLFSAVAALPFLLTGGSVAAPESGIVIRAAASGSHLRLTVENSHLLVNGHLARSTPTGCRLTRGYSAAACRLSEAGSVIVEMGAANDKVTVVDPLPVPLIAYLGAGSDKLIGNAEPDTCYAQGTRRNRCIGNGGDDVCIAGPENTDCVGGPGDDYCKTSGGSDGCWGGPGRDTCVMGSGQDGCHGDAGDDRLFGGSGGDRLYGGRGFDYCDGAPGLGRQQACEEGPARAPKTPAGGTRP
jgi:RTX calcium-binding nonapeptide repeat (4 copies)